MAVILQIPMSDSQTWFSQNLTLSGANYVLEFSYNVRAQLWFMDILDASQNPILLGVPLTIDRDLTDQYATLPLPDGFFFCTDDSGQGTQPTLASFATDHSLLFADRSE